MNNFTNGWHTLAGMRGVMALLPAAAFRRACGNLQRSLKA
jgi:hypothetical protein